MPVDRPRVRRVTLVAMLTLFTALVISCGPGAQDYVYPVAGQYKLYRCSRDVIAIQYDGPAPYPTDTGIDAKVVALNWDERYVLAKQQRGNDKGELLAGEFDWWILDTRDHVRHGPLTEEAFGALRDKFGVDRNLELKQPIEFTDKSR